MGLLVWAAVCERNASEEKKTEDSDSGWLCREERI